MTTVTLRPLDPTLLPLLRCAAVAWADPREVMPPVPGPPGWTPARRAAFTAYHQERSLAPGHPERTFAVLVDGVVAGAARLRPVPGAPGAVEAGLWLGRRHRGTGIGATVREGLTALARDAGHDRLLIRTARTAPAPPPAATWVDLTGTAEPVR